MSAYIVPKAHIDALVMAALRPSGNGRPGSHTPFRWRRPEDGSNWGTLNLSDWAMAAKVGAMLIDANVKSVRWLYNEAGNRLPGPNDPYWARPYTLPTKAPKNFHPVEILSALRGYAYQACETPDWATSEAKAFTDALTDRMVRALPGFSDAPWSIEDDTMPLPKATFNA